MVLTAKNYGVARLTSLAKESLINPLRRAAFEVLNPGVVPLVYFNDANWGDALSPVLVNLLSNRPVKHMAWHHQRRYLAIGSILQHANRWSEVWGSGFLWEHDTVIEEPAKVHAVRGPKSRKKLLDQGIDCPEIYGDPALLFPVFYRPLVQKRYAIGVVPHYIDHDNVWVAGLRTDPAVKIIDVRGGISKFVDEMLSCDLILSSSLHGLIAADAYRVPNIWIELSNKLYGNRFKFYDYFESVHRQCSAPILVHETVSLSAVEREYRTQKPVFDLLKLVDSCPFVCEQIRNQTRIYLIEAKG